MKTSRAHPPPSPGPTSRDAFARAFSRHAAGTRRRRAARSMLYGSFAGLALAAVALLLTTRFTGARPTLAFAAAGLAIGGSVGLLRARARAWSDVDVALFLDKRLGTKEAIVTALEVPEATAARAAAKAALAGATRRDVSVPVLRRGHASGLVACAAFLVVARVPPATIPASVAPGDAKVTLAQVSGLERVEKLARLAGRDDAQRERLDGLAKDARKLREDLARGLEKREAQDRVAKLGDGVRAERLSLGSGEERKAAESAIAALARAEATKRAAGALGDHDLEQMDRELERHANAREAHDRARVKEALEEAEKAARAAGATALAKSLAKDRERLERREARAKTLRDLAKALDDPETKKRTDALDASPSDESAEALARSLADAVSKLSPEERKRLAEKLRALAKREGRQLDPEELERLAERAATPEGARELEKMLRELAEEDDESPEASRQRALDEAESGTDEAREGISGDGSQRGSGGNPDGGSGAPGSGAEAQGNGGSGGVVPVPGGGAGAAGSHHDTGRGDHRGTTPRVDAESFKSRARGPLRPGHLMPGTTTTWRPGEAGGTANVLGTGEIGRAAGVEVEAAERSDVPQEYREQVHRYFRP